MKNKILCGRRFWMASMMAFAVVLFFSGCGKENQKIKESDKSIVKIPDSVENPAMENKEDPATEKETLPDEEKNLLEEMSLEDKVAQMFIVLPEDLIKEADCVTAAGEMTKRRSTRYQWEDLFT